MAGQVRGFQEWRGALWVLCHGAMTPQGAASAQALPEDAFAFAWLHLLRAADGISRAGAQAAPTVGIPGQV